MDALAKLGQKWVKNLNSVLWADRVTVWKLTGYLPFQFIYREDCVLLIELSAETRAIINWNKVNTREKLVATHARQLQRREEDFIKAAAVVKASREGNKKWFDKNKKIHKDDLSVSD